MPSSSAAVSAPTTRRSPSTFGRVLTLTLSPTARAKCACVRSGRSRPGLDTSRVYRPGTGSASSRVCEMRRVSWPSSSAETPPSRSTVMRTTPWTCSTSTSSGSSSPNRGATRSRTRCSVDISHLLGARLDWSNTDAQTKGVGSGPRLLARRRPHHHSVTCPYALSHKAGGSARIRRRGRQRVTHDRRAGPSAPTLTSEPDVRGQGRAGTITP